MHADMKVEQEVVDTILYYELVRARIVVPGAANIPIFGIAADAGCSCSLFSSLVVIAVFDAVKRLIRPGHQLPFDLVKHVAVFMQLILV